MRSNWTETEDRITVEAYFEMLASELKGEMYNKSAIRRSVIPHLNDRSHGSLELKNQNISAVLIQLGYPFIDGYKPRSNFQAFLAETVETNLKSRPDLIKLMPLILSISYLVLAFTGFVFLPLVSFNQGRSFDLSAKRKVTIGCSPLWLLVAASTLLGLLTLYCYRDSLDEIDLKQAIKALWMLAAIIAGIVTQVLVSNKKNGRPLNNFQKGECSFAILVACFIFYPVWAMNEQSGSILAWLYSAYLSGYGWESTIEKSKVG